MKTKLFTFFLALAASVGILFAESGTCGENLTWDLTDGVLTISGTGSMNYYTERMYIPWYYSGRTSIHTVIISNGVTSIGNYAFYDCTGLTSVTIPNSVTSIGERAFNYCISLTSVTIPNSVTSIEWGAFRYCSGLTSVTIPNSVTSIGSFVFQGCSSLTSVTIPNSVTSIGGGAFADCTGLTSVTIPNSVTSIGDNAFGGCSGLTSINIPNSVTSIGNDAFWYVANIVYSGTATGSPWGARSVNGYVDGYLVYSDASKTSLLACSAAAKGDIVIPSSVTSIGENAFYYCSSLISITMESTTPPTLGSEILKNTNLNAIYVPCGTLEAYKSAWSDFASKIKYAPLPYTITTKAVNGYISVPQNICAELQVTATPYRGYRFVKWADGNTDNPRAIELTQDITLEAIFDIALTGKCGKDSALTWTFEPDTKALTITGKGALSENYTYGDFIESVTIGNEITSIGYGAFMPYSSSSLKNVTIGSSVKVIEQYAFYYCTSIQTITCYSMRPPTVNNDAFYGMDYSTIIYVPADYLNNYQMHDFWGMFDVRPLGAATTETTNEVKVKPSGNSADMSWPTVTGATTYELVIKDKSGNVICTLVFNSAGQLTSIAFAAPARDRAPVETLASGFSFTVTGLSAGTWYAYTLTSKDGSGNVLDTKTGSFTTDDLTAIDEVNSASGTSSAPASKLLRSGQVLILRAGKTYTLQGQEVR